MKFSNLLIAAKVAFGPPGLVKIPEAPPPLNPFVTGDMVILKPPNPFKGTMKCGNVYTILRIVSDFIVIRCDNGTEAYFKPSLFELVPPPPVTAAGADEYDEVMRAEQLMEEGKPS